MDLDLPDYTWASQGACRGIDPDVFFPIGDSGRRKNYYNPSKTPKTVDEKQEVIRQKYCEGCAVSRECLDYAISTGQRGGVWGNTTEKQRRPMIVAANKSLYEHHIGQY